MVSCNIFVTKRGSLVSDLYDTHINKILFSNIFVTETSPIMIQSIYTIFVISFHTREIYCTLSTYLYFVNAWPPFRLTIESPFPLNGFSSSIISGHFWLCWLIFPLCRIYASVNRVNIGLDNGLSPLRRQAIIWNSAWLFLIGALGTNASEILVKIQNF